MITYPRYILLLFVLFISCNESTGPDPWVPDVEVNSIKVFYGIGDEFDYYANVIDTIVGDSMPFKFSGEENWYVLNEVDTSLDQITSKGNVQTIVGIITGKKLSKSNLYLKYYGSLKDEVDVSFYNDSLVIPSNDSLYSYGKHIVCPDTSNGVEKALFVLYTSPAYGSISGMNVEIYVKQEDVVIEDYYLTYNAIEWRNND